MQRRVSGFVRTLILATGICSAQIPQPQAGPAHQVEIKLPPGFASESVFIRYRLAGEELGGWVQPRPGVSSYFISTTREGRSVNRIKALLYAPGSALQTLDLSLAGSNNQQYLFTCKPLPSVWISGKLIRSDRLYGREVKLRAKYVARWAQPFLGVRDDIVIDVPVGDAVDLQADGHFRMLVPDLSKDALAGASDHPGALQIWARDKSSEDLIALLIPAGLQVTKSPIGGLRIQPEYPSEIVFAPCSVSPPQLHDVFALRPAPIDSCDP
jgi:hypothetical protein